MNRYAAHVKRVMAQERPHGRAEAVAAMRKAAHLWHGDKIKGNPSRPNPLLIGALALGGWLLYQRSRQAQPVARVGVQTQSGMVGGGLPINEAEYRLLKERAESQPLPVYGGRQDRAY